MRIIVAGGGTGGHITPNIAILEQLISRVPKLEFIYIGSRRGLENKLIRSKGWSFRAICCGKLRRYFSWENFADFFRTCVGIWQSLWIVAAYKPDVIFCKGGFVSLPVAIAGGLLRRPVVIHESDLEMGLANRIAARFARIICVSFPETLLQLHGDKRVIYTGNPVRKELLLGNREKGYQFSGLPKGKKVIMVMGGSQGAQFINALIGKNLKALLEKYCLIHGCGKDNLTDSQFSSADGYYVSEYLGKELPDLYAMADLFIGRAGANTLAEIEALGLPAILIPLVAGSRGDQVKNAESFAKNHLARVLTEGQISHHQVDLLREIDHILIKEGGKRAGQVKNQAAEKIADIIIKIHREHGKKGENRS